MKWLILLLLCLALYQPKDVSRPVRCEAGKVCIAWTDVLSDSK